MRADIGVLFLWARCLSSPRKASQPIRRRSPSWATSCSASGWTLDSFRVVDGCLARALVYAIPDRMRCKESSSVLFEWSHAPAKSPAATH